MTDLKDKVALVTGGVSGIGLAYVSSLLRSGIQVKALSLDSIQSSRSLGLSLSLNTKKIAPNGNLCIAWTKDSLYRVAFMYGNDGLSSKHISIIDIDDKKGKEVMEHIKNKYGQDRAEYINCDVTKEKLLEAAFRSTIQRFKRLDIVINNAGIFNDKNWQFCITLNCNAVVHGCLLAAKYMGKNNSGRGGIVVNTASILGLQEISALPVYTATKHFVVGFTRSMGQPFYYNLTGIKYMALCPGVTETPLVVNAAENIFPHFDNLLEEFDRIFMPLPRQSVDYVGEALIDILSKGQNGSCWVSEGKEPAYPIVFPDRRTLRT